MCKKDNHNEDKADWELTWSSEWMFETIVNSSEIPISSDENVAMVEYWTIKQSLTVGNMMTKQQLDDYKRRIELIMSDPKTIKQSEEFHRKMQRKNSEDMDLRFTIWTIK